MGSSLQPIVGILFIVSFVRQISNRVLSGCRLSGRLSLLEVIGRLPSIPSSSFCHQYILIPLRSGLQRHLHSERDRQCKERCRCCSIAANSVYDLSSLDSNVRGQGTRHLVEGTLDPLVGSHCFHPVWIICQPSFSTSITMILFSSRTC